MLYYVIMEPGLKGNLWGEARSTTPDASPSGGSVPVGCKTGAFNKLWNVRDITRIRRESAEDGVMAKQERSKKPTRDDLKTAAEAAMKAAGVVAEALESGEVDLGDLEQRAGLENGDAPLPKVTPNPATGVAYEEFMAALGPTLEKFKNQVTVDENAGWMKIEGTKSHERVYVAKGKRSVNRITCTLPPDAVDGAEEPTSYNGLIRSWLPASPKAVAKAIELIATAEPPKPQPRRSGGRQQDK